MTMIETGDPRHQVFCDAEHAIADLSDVYVESDRGALVLIGPGAGELPYLDALLDLPQVDSVEAISARMMDWNTVSAETIEVGRSASHSIRNGRTAVVHLDSHSGEAPPVPIDAREFVCTRLGQILIGIADTPAYVVTHGERMASALIIDSLEDRSVEAVRSGDEGFGIWRLSNATMFPGLCVARSSSGRPNPIADALCWFEARRL